MRNPFIVRLEKHGALSDGEKRVLIDMASHVKTFRPDEDIVPAGSVQSHSSLMIEGFAVRYMHLLDGRRQIAAVHVPGDFADLHSYLLKRMDDGVLALTTCRVALVPHAEIDSLVRDFPQLTRVLWFSTLRDGAVHRAWITSLGAMGAKERLAHFFCELRDRLRMVGKADANSFEFPFTQDVLGDAFGMSTVHVNRTLQSLRADGLITTRGKTLTINNWPALVELAQYDPGYLHLDEQLERIA